eukprot:3389358-Prymnesium_polylepis.2
MTGGACCGLFGDYGCAGSYNDCCAGHPNLKIPQQKSRHHSSEELAEKSHRIRIPAKQLKSRRDSTFPAGR